MPPQPQPGIAAMVLLALLGPTNSVPAQALILEGDRPRPFCGPSWWECSGPGWRLGTVGARAGGAVVGNHGLRARHLTKAPESTSPFRAVYAAIHIAVCAPVILLVVLPNSRRAYT
jgi:hypothetical protein